MSLDLGSELEGQPFEEGASRERVFLLGASVKGMTGGTGLPVMPVPCVQGLGFPRSVTFWKPPLTHALGGFSGQAQLAPRTLAFQHHAPMPLPHVK